MVRCRERASPRHTATTLGIERRVDGFPRLWTFSTTQTIVPGEGTPSGVIKKRATCGIRTRDPRFTKAVLYQLKLRWRNEFRRLRTKEFRKLRLGGGRRQGPSPLRPLSGLSCSAASPCLTAIYDARPTLPRRIEVIVEPHFAVRLLALLFEEH